jgi:hypothetical protein
MFTIADLFCKKILDFLVFVSFALTIFLGRALKRLSAAIQIVLTFLHVCNALTIFRSRALKRFMGALYYLLVGTNLFSKVLKCLSGDCV